MSEIPPPPHKRNQRKPRYKLIIMANSKENKLAQL